VGKNASSDVASMRILEALCVSQGWGHGREWVINEDGKAPGIQCRVGRTGTPPRKSSFKRAWAFTGAGADLPGVRGRKADRLAGRPLRCRLFGTH